jgi:hypothetical protein
MKTKILCAVFLLLAPAYAQAQASLAAEDIIDEVPVTVAGQRESFTLIRDAHRPEQWYYVPDRPRLFERSTSGGQIEPDFVLLRYQLPESSSGEKLVEGGLMQFALTMGLPQEALPQLKKAIAATKTVAAEKIRLAALPFEAAKVHLIFPSSGDLIASQPQGPGIAPTFATQKVAFSVSLTRIGADVFDALVSGNTGLAVAVEFDYKGLSPAAGFTITVDWDQAYRHFSSDKQLRGEAAALGSFGLKASVDRSKVLNQLTSNKILTVEVTEGGSFTSEQMSKYVDQILQRINSELTTALAPPTAVAAAQANDLKGPEGYLEKIKDQLTGGLGYSVAMKDERSVKKGRERIIFRGRSILTRKTIAGGFVGVGRYPKEVRDRLVTIVPPGPWKSAFFMLPSVGDGAQAGISQVDLQVRLKYQGKPHDEQTLRWTPDAGWIGRDNKPRAIVAFGLLNLRAIDPSLAGVSFESVAQITQRNDVIHVKQEFALESGDNVGLIPPMALAKVVRVDGSRLDWKGVEPTSDLMTVSVVLRSGERSFTGRLAPRNIDGRWAPPEPLVWIVPRGVPVTADITFVRSDGTEVAWKRNRSNLAEGQEQSGELFVDLLNDWRKP